MGKAVPAMGIGFLGRHDIAVAVQQLDCAADKAFIPRICTNGVDFRVVLVVVKRHATGDHTCTGISCNAGHIAQIINRAGAIQLQSDPGNAVDVDQDLLNATIRAARDRNGVDQVTVGVEQADMTTFFSIKDLQVVDEGRRIKFEPDGATMEIVIRVRAVIVLGDDQNFVTSRGQVTIAAGWVCTVEHHRVIW